jgi:hypothetical protein
MRYPLHRHIGHADDRDVPSRRMHDPRSAQAPEGGLNRDPSFYSDRQVENAPYVPTGVSATHDEPAVYDATERPPSGTERRNVRPEREATPRQSYVGMTELPELRADRAILDAVLDALDVEEDIDAGGVEVHVADGEVLLRGYVDDPEQRWRIEDIAYNTRGVTDVINHLRVRTH